MMGPFKVFDVVGSALTAQTVRLNTISSNLANADVVSTTQEGAYRAKQPIFATVLDRFNPDPGTAGVKVLGITQSTAAPMRQYDPSHPQANEEGYVFRPNINVVEEMANMISASRTYQANVEVMNTSKRLILNTLRLGQG